jgi:hypothetical protein
MSTAGFVPLRVTSDLDQTPWPDLDGVPVLTGALRRIGLVRHRTVRGRAGVVLMVELDDGTVVLADTTWRLFKVATRALMATPVAAEEVEDDA